MCMLNLKASHPKTKPVVVHLPPPQPPPANRVWPFIEDFCVTCCYAVGLIAVHIVVNQVGRLYFD